MTINEFLSKVQEIYAVHMPNSKIFCNFGGQGHIWIMPMLARNKEELSGGYWDNDMLSIHFTCHLGTHQERYHEKKYNSRDDELPEVMTFEMDAKSFVIKPVSNPHLAYDRVKLPYRKISASPEKVLATFDKYFKILKDELARVYHEDLIENKLHKANVENKII